jgi:proteasome accessory factor C
VPDRLERLTDLVLVLLDASRPLTLDAIADQVPGYPVEHAARRQAFERDKRLLRDEGIPVLTESIGGPEQFGYRIDPDAFYLPNLGLEPDEQAALHLAVAAVELGDPSGRQALLKLGATGISEPRPVASFVAPPALVDLFEAVRAHAAVTFSYRGEARHVSPASLRFRQGRWYSIGWDHDRGASRTFRVDRMDDRPEVGPPGSSQVPDDFDASAVAPEEPYRPGEGDVDDVLLWVDPVEAARVSEEVGHDYIEERRPDGSVVLRLSTANADVLRSWVLGLLDHAEIIGSTGMRTSIIAWLEAIVEAEGKGESAVAVAASETSNGSATNLAEPVEGRPRDASTRLRRLLAIVGWLAQVGEASIVEISQRFGIGEEELVQELELAACCGLPPYSPDVLMEILVTDGAVSTYLPAEMARPRRLTAAEGFALAAAGKTILAVPGADENGALSRALRKLETALGDQNRLVVDIDEPSSFDAVQRATEDHLRIEIEYHSASGDETTQRVVDPVQLVSLEGHWYLDAFCHRADGLRRFRVDRIRSVKDLGPQPEDRAEPVPLRTDAFVPGPGATAVQLALPPEALWVVDGVPLLGSEPTTDGGRVVVMAVGGRAWLERLLLQAGAHARVLGPAELLDAGPGAARRVLRRYRS